MMSHLCLADSHTCATRLREIRKLIGRVIGTRGSLVKFYPSQDYQATMFLKRVMDDPSKLDEVWTFSFLTTCPVIFTHAIHFPGHTQVS